MNRELKDIIKLSGVKLDEEWANTPDVTNHPDQEEMGDLRDWGTNVELSLRKYLNHNLASPEFPQPITEEEMTASYKIFINEVHEEIVEKAKDEEEAEEVEEAKEEDAEEVTEAQSPAQKAAFEKMLAAKNGNKEEATDDVEEEKVEEAKEEADDEETVEETVDPYSGLYRMLTLAGITPQHELSEKGGRGRASMGGGPGHRDPTFTSTAPGHAGSYGGGPESGPGDEEHGVQSSPHSWGTDYQAAMAKKQQDRPRSGGPDGGDESPDVTPQKGEWTKSKPVITKAGNYTKKKPRKVGQASRTGGEGRD